MIRLAPLVALELKFELLLSWPPLPPHWANSPVLSSGACLSFSVKQGRGPMKCSRISAAQGFVCAIRKSLPCCARHLRCLLQKLKVFLDFSLRSIFLLLLGKETHGHTHTRNCFWNCDELPDLFLIIFRNLATYWMRKERRGTI